MKKMNLEYVFTLIECQYITSKIVPNLNPLIFRKRLFPGPKTILVKDINIGTISSGYSNAPTCTASGCVIFKADPGTYNWKAVVPDNNTVYWTGTVIITAGGCTPVDVTI